MGRHEPALPLSTRRPRRKQDILHKVRQTHTHQEAATWDTPHLVCRQRRQATGIRPLARGDIRHMQGRALPLACRDIRNTVRLQDSIRERARRGCLQVAMLQAQALQTLQDFTDSSSSSSNRPRQRSGRSNNESAASRSLRKEDRDRHRCVAYPHGPGTSTCFPNCYSLRQQKYGRLSTNCFWGEVAAIAAVKFDRHMCCRLHWAPLFDVFGVSRFRCRAGLWLGGALSQGFCPATITPEASYIHRQVPSMQ